MSTQYTTEPPPSATVLVHTTAGPLTLSLFTQQAPLTCRNFLQHCIDGTYTNTIFHRVAPGFVIQTGDPTGTGEGGTNIYEDGDKSLERYGETWGRLLRLPEERWGDRITFGDEVHSRLKFNRRGLVGMARMGEERGEGKQGQYGTQWFITLDDCRAELDGKCTMFGRVEGDGIYNVMKIAGGEVIEGTERPVYPEKVTGIEVLEWPEGLAWKGMKKRERVAERTADDAKSKKKDKGGKKKGGKALLSFGADGDGDEEGSGVAVRPKKAKFNTALIDVPGEKDSSATNVSKTEKKNEEERGRKRKSPELTSTKRPPEPEPKRRKPSFHEPTTQLPLRDPESPSRSPTPELPQKRRLSNHKSAAALEAEIAALKASMRRDTAPAPQPKQKLSALEALIPATSTRGRKRPRPGEIHGADDTSSLKMLNAFKARLENADQASKAGQAKTASSTNGTKPDPQPDAPDEEATLCDLHFIANCRSCSDWADEANNDDGDDDGDRSFLNHALTFEKDRLGKDLTWKQKNEEELVVIDPREREKELGIKAKHRDKERAWDKDRDRDSRRNERRVRDR